jgi:hypothetical protein
MRSTRAGRRTAPGRTGLLALGVLALGVLVGCPAAEGNPGFDPPPNNLKFPSGLLLDPRVSTDPVPTLDDAPCSSEVVTPAGFVACPQGSLCTSADVCRIPPRWMFVTNANSDRRFNAASLMAIDLDAFFDAAFEGAPFDRDPESDEPEILGPSAALPFNPDDPENTDEKDWIGDWANDSPVCGGASGDLDNLSVCRRVANLPQVVECLEEPFVCSESTIHFGNFAGPAVAWDETPGDDETALLIPVRGDPSVTYVELSGTDTPKFECGQKSDGDGGRFCDDRNRLRFLRNDSEATRLSREPFRILVSTEPGPRPLAYVSHQGDRDLSLFALDGVQGVGLPALIHQTQLLGWPGPGSVQGGFGLAQRPCELPDNAPNSTLGCTRPLIYASMRWQAQVRTMTAINANLDVCDTADLDEVDPDLVLTYCEAQAEPVRYLSVGNFSLLNVLDPSTGLPLPSRPILADIAFSRSGNELYVLQSNPGGLLRLDTSIGADGETRDVPAGQVELCAQGTSLAIYDDGGSQFALVTCYRSAEVFIVDLASLTVVGVARGGIGTDALTVDLAREVVYVANSLDGPISVIVMSADRATRFNQIARIGVQEPYEQ